MDRKRPLTHLQVLLVEDEPDIADLLLFVLEDAGAKVKLVTSAEAALSLLKQYQPDVLVCNVKLPHQNGDWLMQQVRSHPSHQHLPAIAITAYDREVSPDRMLAAGFNRFHHKLANPHTLVTEIQQLISANPEFRVSS